MIRAVTFDVGGTLIEPWPSVGHVYATVAARHGWSGLSVGALNHGFGIAWAGLRKFDYSRAEWLALVKATFQEVMAKPVSPAMFSELYDEFSQPESWHVYKDVVPTLAQLSKRGLKLGIISNWDRRLGILLRRLGLWDFFDVKVVSCHAGEPKPSKGIFRKAANRLGLAPESILHVGDSFEADVAGALQAGFQSVLLRRDNAGARRGAIHSLDELERVLRRLGTREFD